MATKIRTLGPGKLDIGESSDIRNLAADCTNVTLTPSNDTEDADNYLDGHVEGGATTTNWELGGSIAEDYSMDGAQVWCLRNSGKTMPFTWTPNTGGGLSIKGNVTIQPIGFGGDVKSKNKLDFTFPATDIEAVAYTPQ